MASLCVSGSLCFITDVHDFNKRRSPCCFWGCYYSWGHEKCICRPANNIAADVSMGLEEASTTTVGCLPSCLSNLSGTQCHTQNAPDICLLTRCLIWYLGLLISHRHCDKTPANTLSCWDLTLTFTFIQTLSSSFHISKTPYQIRHGLLNYMYQLKVWFFWVIHATLLKMNHGLTRVTMFLLILFVVGVIVTTN